MNCDKFDRSISLYIDNELNDIEKREFELHLMKCEKCRKEYESMINILKIVRDNDQEELPEGYRVGLKGKLIEVCKEQRKIVNWKFIASIAASLLVLLTSYELIYNNMFFRNKSDYNLEQEQSIEMQITSDATDEAIVMTQENSKKEMDTNMALMDQAPEQTAYNDSNKITRAGNEAVEFKGENNNGIQATRSIMPNRKSIKEAYIDIDIDEFDNTSEKIIDYVNENNGFVESMKIEDNQENTNNHLSIKRGIIKIRIPQDKFDQTIDFIKELGTLNNVQFSVNDVTEEYYNIENDLFNLHDKDFRLGEILNKAENIDDILLIEDEINKVKNQIENHSDTLKEMDNSASLSTINTTLNENND